MIAAARRRNASLATAIYVAGAAVYYAWLGLLGHSFQFTPFVLGLIMLAAVPFRRRVLPSAVLLLAWGAAVLGVHWGWLPAERAAPAYITAFGLGLLVLLAARRWIEPRLALESAASVMTAGGLFFYAAFSYDALTEAWLWAVLLLANAAVLMAAEAWRTRASLRHAHLLTVSPPDDKGGREQAEAGERRASSLHLRDPR